MDSRKQGRRIVSRGEYRKLLLKRAGAGGLGTILLIFTCLIALVTFGLFAVVLASLFYFGIAGAATALFALFMVCVCAVITKTSGDVASTMMNHFIELDTLIEQVDIGALVLPDPEVLVRSSQEPIEQQQAILLRATNDINTTPVEQLVRPSGNNDA